MAQNGNLSERMRKRQQIAELLGRSDVFILDTETTGLRNAEVIEVSIINTKGELLLDTLVEPSELVMNRHAQRVHGIALDMLAGQPSWPDVLPDLHRVLDRGTVLAWNASFDARMLKQTSEVWKIQQSSYLFVCAMRLYASLFGRRSYALHKAVVDARLAHLLEQHQSHRALGDVRLVLALLQAASEESDSAKAGSTPPSPLP